MGERKSQLQYVAFVCRVSVRSRSCGTQKRYQRCSRRSYWSDCTKKLSMRSAVKAIAGWQRVYTRMTTRDARGTSTPNGSQCWNVVGQLGCLGFDQVRCSWCDAELQQRRRVMNSEKVMDPGRNSVTCFSVWGVFRWWPTRATE